MLNFVGKTRIFVQILCRNTMGNIRFFVAAAFLSAFITGCGKTSGYQVFSGYAQGGTYRITADLSTSVLDRSELAAGIDSVLNRVDSCFSGYNRNSLVSRFNRGESVAPDSLFDRLLAISEHFKEVSSGAFDVAAAPLFDIWGFGFTRDSLPPAETVDRALELCKEGKRLNFNAIAQGFTCDLVASYLRSAGIVNMLVDIGEIYCEGVNPSGRPWSIGIDTPEDGNNIPGASLSGVWHSDGSAHGVVTSGNYRKFYIHDGRKYAHTIDPRTGYPVDHDLLSATVIASDATTADALATFFMVVGAEEAIEWVESHDGIEACLICSDTTVVSRGFYR